MTYFFYSKNEIDFEILFSIVKKIKNQIYSFSPLKTMAYDSKHVQLLAPEAGYNLTKNEYKKYRPHLNSFYSLDFNRFVPRERKDFSVLDLGAGDGRMYDQLKKINPDHYIACDCAKELLAKHPGRIKKVVCDLEKQRPFDDQSFDLLSAFFLLEHIEKLEHFFEEAYRICKDNGQLLIGHFLQRRLFTRTVNGNKFKIQQFAHTIEDLERAAKEAGFQT